MHDVDVGSELSLVSGPGNPCHSHVFVSGVTVVGKTSIGLGAERDLVIIDDALFGEFFLSTGHGADTIEIEQREDRDGTTLFLGKTKFDLGNGTDALLVGVADDSTRRLQVFADTTFDGTGKADTRAFDNLCAPFIEPLVLDFEDDA